MISKKKPSIQAALGPRCKVAALLLSILIFVEHTVEVHAASIGIGNTRGFPGEFASVPFAVREATNLVAAQFDIRFDTTKGELTSPRIMGRNSKAILRSREVAPGVHRVLVYSPNNSVLRTNGFAGAFSFGVARGERLSSGPITPLNGVLAGSNGTRIATTSLSSGTVFVVPYYRNPSSGLVELFFPSIQDRKYLVQASEDLVHWVNVSTNLAVGEFIDFVDLDAPVFPYRFYRTADLDSAVAISAIRRLPDGGVAFEVGAAVDRAFVIQVSDDLVTWRDVAVRPSVHGVVSYSDISAGESGRRFYRFRAETPQGP